MKKGLVGGFETELIQSVKSLEEGEYVCVYVP